MSEAAGLSEQAMLSVAGLEQPKLTALCEQAQKSGGKDAVCQIANILFPKGFSCAGTKKAIETLKGLAEQNGAMQARMLKTSGGFHTSLMAPAQKKLEVALTATLPNMKVLEKGSLFERHWEGNASWHGPFRNRATAEGSAYQTCS